MALLAVSLLLTACVGAFPSPPRPLGIEVVPETQVASWVASTRPAKHTQLKFRWRVTNGEGGGGGRGGVLIAPPDSLRLDFHAALGLYSGAAAVVGSSALWAQPEDQVQKFVPNYWLLWALVGIARPPDPAWRLEGRRDPNATAWRYTRGADTIDYVWWIRNSVANLEAYVSENGKPVGRVITVFDSAGRPARSRLEVLSAPARLDITFEAVPKPLVFDRSYWLAPHDP